MKLNPKYILREVAGETLLVSLADVTAPKRLLCLNVLGKDIYSLLQKGLSVEEISAALLEEYDVEPQVLKADLNEFLEALKAYGVIE